MTLDITARQLIGASLKLLWTGIRYAPTNPHITVYLESGGTVAATKGNRHRKQG